MTTKQIDALEQALEALDRCVATCFDRYAHEQVMSRPEHFVNQAITAIREALAEQPAQHDLKPKFVRNVDGVPCITLVEHEHLMRSRSKPAQQQEPVAVYVGETWCGSVVRLYEDLPLETPLYTSPPASKPLTDAQIGAVAAEIWGSVLIAPQSYQAFARAIEAAHGITGEQK